MHLISAVVLSMFAAVAAAQSPTPLPSPSRAESSSANPTGTTLPDLVTQFEPCALLCYNAAAIDAACDPGDWSCVCDNPGSLVVKMSICVGKACDGQQPFDSGVILEKLCAAHDAKPSASAVARASSVLHSEISSVAKTATSNPAPQKTNNAPAGGDAAMGLLGIAAVAALMI